jgi:hypothetical protein
MLREHRQKEYLIRLQNGNTPLLVPLHVALADR